MGYSRLMLIGVVGVSGLTQWCWCRVLHRVSTTGCGLSKICPLCMGMSYNGGGLGMPGNDNVTRNGALGQKFSLSDLKCSITARKVINNFPEFFDLGRRHLQ